MNIWVDDSELDQHILTQGTRGIHGLDMWSFLLWPMHFQGIPFSSHTHMEMKSSIDKLVNDGH